MIGQGQASLLLFLRPVMIKGVEFGKCSETGTGFIQRGALCHIGIGVQLNALVRVQVFFQQHEAAAMGSYSVDLW